MIRFDAIKLIAAREIRERLRSKALRASTALTLLFILGVAIIPGLRSDGNGRTTYDVGVAGEGGDELEDGLRATSDPSGGTILNVSRFDDAAAAAAAVRAGKVDAAVVDGRDLLVDEGIKPLLNGVVQAVVKRMAAERALAEAGVTDPATAAVLLDPPTLSIKVLDPDAQARGVREGLVYAGTFLLYGQLLGFGYWVASGVIEEKSSRVIELLLAKVKPTQVLIGKVLGIGLLGLVQLFTFVGVGLGAAQVAGTVDLPPETAGVAVNVVIWFVLGYALYSCLFAVGGALASRAEEMQATTMPLQVATVASFIAATVAAEDPGGTVARFASFIPVSAPFVLPIRSSAGELPLWELVACVALVLASIAVATRVAGRVYSGAALHLRGQLGLRQALRMGTRR